jgi:ferredoxin
MEEDYGRARAMAQGIDSDEKLQEAIDTCPVNCIYWCVMWCGCGVV